VVDGIRITRFAQPFEGRGRAGLVLEYAIAALSIGAALVRELCIAQPRVIQVVNPPDWLAAPALLMKPLGIRVAFDMADFTPHLYEAKFGRGGAIYRTLNWINGMVLRHADLVVTPNAAYRRIAQRMGRRSAARTIAVHSYPPVGGPRPFARPVGLLRIGYLGVLGSHDGVAALLQAVGRLPRDGGLAEFELVIVGDGPAAPELRSLTSRLGLEQNVRFLGFLEGEVRDAAVAAFDIAVACDPVNRYTRHISLNKIFVYAAFGVPILATPLRGTQRLLGDAAAYTADDSAYAIADGLRTLLRDAGLRRRLARKALERAERHFNWDTEAARYAGAVAALVAPTP
jgi:glycosyltransferase involved in cell wall biosynthesis